MAGTATRQRKDRKKSGTKESNFFPKGKPAK